MKFSNTEKGVVLLWVGIVGSSLWTGEYDLPIVLCFALLLPVIYIPLKYFKAGSKKRRKEKRKKKRKKNWVN